MDGAARPGRADGDHQDPPAAVLRHGRAAHPAFSPALALGGAVRPRSRPAASDSTPGLTAPVRHPANRTRCQLAPVRSARVSCCVLSPPSRPAQRPQTAIGPLCDDCRPSATSEPPQWSRLRVEVLEVLVPVMDGDGGQSGFHHDAVRRCPVEGGQGLGIRGAVLQGKVVPEGSESFLLMAGEDAVRPVGPPSVLPSPHPRPPWP